MTHDQPGCSETIQVVAKRRAARTFLLGAVAFFGSTLFASTAFAQVDVTATAGTLNASYTTLKGAFDAINAGTHQGTITIGMSGNTTETAAAVLNASGAGSANYASVSISPTGGAARTISGALATPLIDLNGADNVTIDGLNSGGNSLTLSNASTSSTAGTSTIRFLNGATNNQVTRCSILGSSLVITGTAGGNVLFHTTTTVGNSNNTVSNNQIGPAGASLPIKCISAVGTNTNATTQNSNNIIDGNNIFNFFGTGAASVAGIDIRTGNTNWTISNNRIYQTATRTFTTTALRYSGILVNGLTTAPAQFHTISGNIIGFGAADGTGTTTITGSSNEFRGIDVPAVSTTTATSIQGNVISGISQTTSRASTTLSAAGFTGITIGATNGLFNVGNVTGNSIGSLDGSSTIVVNATSTTASTTPAIGIFDFNFGGTDNISNNTMGAITINSGGAGTTVGFRGIMLNQNTGNTTTCNNNIIGGTNAAGAITDNIVGNYAMYGIQAINTNLIATGNVVRNMTGNANGNVVVIGGLLCSGSTGANTISQNTVHSLSNTVTGGVAGGVYGIDCAFPATANIVERNLVHSLNVNSTLTAYQLWGMVMRGQGSAIFKNNMVRLGHDAAGNSITTGFSIIGFRQIAGASGNFYHNSAYIGGTGVASASNTYAFFSDVVTNSRDFRNNIFYNGRSNASGGIVNVAIRVGGTAPNPAGLTSDYNVVYADGIDGTTGVYNAAVVPTLAAWQAATGQDNNSIAADPLYVAPNGNAVTGDLHIQVGATPIESAGDLIASVADDYDGETRASLSPVDIGADAANFVNTGACCLPSGCQQMSEQGCTTQGGTAWFDGVDCADANCPPTGRCCAPNGTCAMLTEAACDTSAGYTWDGSLTCDTPCTVGACCVKGNCSQTTQAGCGGTWNEGAPCETSAYDAPNPGTTPNTLPVAIPDGGGTANPVIRELTVPDSYTISNLRLRFELAHTWYGDLRMILTHVDTGTAVTIMTNATPDDSSNLIAGGFYVLDDAAAITFDQAAVNAPGTADNIPHGSYRPDNPLSAFNGESAAGTWRLTVSDHVTIDTGTLHNWGLLIEGQCAEATGACCTTAGCVILTEAECDGAGGWYYGDNSECPNLDDGNACTADSCDPQTGDPVHTPNYDPQTHCCNPATGDTTMIDDGDACTIDECNPATGEVTHTPVDCDDNDPCTIDACVATESRGGNPCVVPDNGGGTVTLPPAGCEYLSPDDVHMILDGLPPGTTIEFAAIHKDFICHVPGQQNPVCSFPTDVDCDDPGGSLGGEKECAESMLEMQLQGTGTLAGFNRPVTIPIGFETHVGPRTPGNPVQSFDTDMFRLFGQLPPGDPDFDLLRVTGGTDFGLPSPGHTTLTQLPGGNWAVDSFFDITYRIDFVGAPGGPLAGMSGSTTATIRMATGNPSGYTCEHTPIVCDDNDPCTTDACVDGECVYTPIVCDDNDACTTDACVNGECVYTPITCDDLDPCTIDSCVDGQCVNTPVDCDDNDPCTIDACVATESRGGNPCVVPDNGGGTVTLPPAGCEYLSPDDVHMILDGLPPGTTIEFAAIHKNFICNKPGTQNPVCTFPPGVDCTEVGGSLGGEKECVTSTLEMQLHGTGTLAGFDRPVMLPIAFETHTGPRTPGNPVQSFDTDMFRLFGQITGDPDFDLLRVTGGTDFGLPSPGHTTLTQLPGGNWAVDSFFDITYRIDFVGAPGGPLAGMSGSTTATIRMATGNPSGYTCEHTPIVCDDNDPCTTDACVEGECVYTPIVCDDNDACTTDACVNGECVYTPITCDDLDPCTIDSCVDGQCVNTPVDCDDNDPCTIDACVATESRGGNPCVVPDNGGGTVTLPPAGCEYLSPDDVHMILDGLPPGTTIEFAAIHKDFICGGAGTPNQVCSFPTLVDCDDPGGSLGGEKECAESMLEMQLQGTGTLAGFNRPVTIPIGFETHVGPRTPGNPVQSFDTDMFRLFGQITGDPDFDLLRVTGGTDFGLPSPGHTTLTQLPGGNWAVDSFFDITYRIDFVGAPGGPLAGMSGSTTATIRMATGNPSGYTCEHTPIVCDDNDPCTTDACVEGECVYTPIVCDDNDACTTDACVNGECVYTPITCDDLDPCTIDSCVDGQCVNTPVDCDDNDPCTIDACVATESRGGNPCVVPDNGGGTVTLPPAGCEYLSPDDVHMILDGLPPGTTIEFAAIHKDFICHVPGQQNPVCSFPTDVDCDDPGGSLGGEKECAESMLEMQLQGTGTLAGFNRPVTIPIGFETHVGPRTPGNPVQSFDTDMFRLFGQITGDPDFDLLRVTGGTDFGLPSPGHTTLTQLPGGNWAVDSFFDITYRIDFVGAPGGPLAGMSGSTTATIRMATGNPSGYTCEHTPIVCDDNDPCTTDACVEGECVYTPIVCDDNDACTTDACVNGECVYTPITCDDLDPCTIDSCVDGQCVNTPVDCDDNDPCTIDACVATESRGGNPCVVPDNGGGTVTLPPAGCEYLSPDDVHMILDGLPPGTTIEFAAIHKDFICNKPGTQNPVCTFPPGVDCTEVGGSLGGEKECVTSTLEMQLHGTGALAGFDRPVMLPIAFETHTGPRTPGNPVQSFDTDMFRLFGQLPPGDPDFDLLRVTGGTDFGLPSPGHTTLTQLPGGNWAVDSFFDITYRIDFVGAPGGPLAGMSGSTTATIRMATGNPSGYTCEHTPIVCDDNDPCTTDACVDGECVYTPIVCDDNDACTTDACVNGECVYTPTTVTVDVTVQLGGGVMSNGPFDRAITFELWNPVSDPGGPLHAECRTITFTGGVGSATLEVPCHADGYTCITARDRLHTLRRTISPIPQVGPNYLALFTNANGGKALVGGNLNDDRFIDLIDFGIYTLQDLTPAPGGANTTCAQVPPLRHADVNGDGIVNSIDFSFVANNFLLARDPDCDGSLLTGSGGGGTGGGQNPVTSITVAELHKRGLGELAIADLNRDGVLDMTDMTLWAQGVRPPKNAVATPPPGGLEPSGQR